MSLDALLNELPKKIEALCMEVRQLRTELRAAQHPEKLSYSTAEAAEAMGLSYEKVYAMCKSGEIRASQTGPKGSLLIARTDLIDWLNRNNCAPQVPETPVIQLPISGAAKRILNKGRFTREQQ